MILLHNEDFIENLDLIIKPSIQNEQDVTVGCFDFANFTDDKDDTEDNMMSDYILHNFDEDMENADDISENMDSISEKHDKQELTEDLLLYNKRLEEEFQKRAEQIILEANEQANEIIKRAEIEAAEVKEKAFAQGKEDGYNDGYNKAYSENKVHMEEETIKFFLELKDVIESFKAEKNKLISENINELKEIALAISEKVIQVSLKTSGEIIKKMIVSSTEKLKTREWAKIYIAKCDASIVLESNSDLLRVLNRLSEHIKITVMEDSAPGTCIIELPDQIIDASASTQLENINNVIKGVGGDGGL